MTSWTTITDATLSANKPLTQSVARALRDNVAAAFEKSASAPVLANDYVVEAMVNAAAISQGKLKTTTGETSGSIGSVPISAALPGGEYGFWPQMRVTDTGSTAHRIGVHGDVALSNVTGSFFLYYDHGSTSTADTGFHSGTVVFSFTATGGSPTGYLRQRYVQASPPWEPFLAGDPVPIFVYVKIDKASGAVMQTWTAEDPPWCNQGPTVVNPLGRLAGVLKDRLGVQWSAAKADRASALAYLNALEALSEEYHRARSVAAQVAAASVELALARAALASAPALTATREREAAAREAMARVETELAQTIHAELAREIDRPLSQAEKNADMPLVPHPFVNVDPATEQVLLLAPTDSRFCRALRHCHCDLGDSVGEILHGDYVQIDNDPMPGIVTPPGVMAVAARWRA